MGGWQEYEGIAREALERAHQHDVVDLHAVARALDVVVLEGTGRSWAAGDVIHLRAADEPRRRRWLLAHELGHVLADRAGLDRSDETIANGIANALVIPDPAAKRDLRRFDGAVAPIRERHELSWEVTLRRLVTVQSFVGALWRDGRLVWSGRSPWLRNAVDAGVVAALPRQLAGEHHELVLAPPERVEDLAEQLMERRARASLRSTSSPPPS